MSTLAPATVKKPGSYRLPGGMEHYSSKSEMSDDRIAHLETLAYRYGKYFDSYLVLQPDREYLWGSDGQSVIGFHRVGKCLHVAGGLISASSRPVDFLREIVEFVERNQLVISFFNLDREDAQWMNSFGFQRTLYGIESRIPLEEHHWGGRPYSWVRRQCNYVNRQRVRFEEWDTEPICQGLAPDRLLQLQTVSDQHLIGKTLKSEIPFFEGRLLPGHLHRKRVFVARSDDREGRLEGFAICNPMLDGSQWSIEMFRQRDDAVRGTIAFLIREIVDQLKQEDCSEVSICPIPAIGTDRKLEGESRKVKLSLYLWEKSGRLMFDSRGLYHFKSRFRPEFSDTFICAYPRSTWGAVWAYLKLVSAFDLKWSQVLQNVLRPNFQRKTLAQHHE
ncbi:MAG: DUF2156 domain-containing protein [Planctomycetaceae bacterium]|nr:DUF2156 domain-containing protein [Planctomycetaceae bacterium]